MRAACRNDRVSARRSFLFCAAVESPPCRVWRNDVMSEVLEIDRRAGSNAPLFQEEALAALEGGAVAYLPHDAFEMQAEERRFLDPSIVAQPRKHSGRARIIYLPAKQRLLKSTLQGKDRQDLEAMMVRFSDWSRDLIAELFP